MPLSAGQVLNNRYRIASLLGQGSFGAVYHALDLTLNTPVALKEYLNTSPEAVQQFELEARLLANMRHENLPYVIDHFSLLGQGQYLVMELVEGQDLQTIINRAGRGLPEMQVLSWIEPVCEALTFLHSQSPPIIHRDVKPANIKITPKGQVVLVDFGIAKTPGTGPEGTVRAATVVHGFMAPEQFAGVTDERSDIYALGATLYAALTGRAPVDSRQRQMGHALPPPRQLNQAITPRTEAAILQALELAPERRFQNLEETKTALGMPLPAFQAAQAVATVDIGVPEGYAPTAPPARSGSWVLWAVIVFAALCLLGGILGSVGAYLYIISPDRLTPTQISQDLSATGTALASQLVSPIPPTSAPATSTATPTLEPSLTSTLPVPPSPTLTLTPTLSPSPSQTGEPQGTWQPCAGIYPSRLHVGGKAYVAYDPPLPNRVRVQPNTDSPVLGFLQPGDRMDILEGPVCSNQWIWWRVRAHSTGMTGWTAEGDETDYWLVPYP